MKLRVFILLWNLHYLQFAFCQDEECANKLTYCNDLRAQCKNPRYRDFLRDHCPVTCLQCPRDIDPEGLCKNKGGCEHRCEVINKTKKKCTCYENFVLEPDQVTCVDLDECAENKHSCKPGQICKNLHGSHACEESTCYNRGLETYFGRADCCQKPESSTCGVIHLGISERIVGGTGSDRGQWPWQVLIILDRQRICGGTLLSNTWVVTAAHCFRKFESSTRMDLYFGALTLDGIREEIVQHRSFSRYEIHPDWNMSSSSSQGNDIALIEVNRAVNINKWVRPACLPNGEKPRVGTTCHAAGWGLLSERGHSPSKRLQHVDLPIVDHSKCASAYAKINTTIIKEGMICAGHDEGGKDACKGDSGGPLVCQRCGSCQWFLSGITSFGSGCARQGFYGVFTNVHKYEDWIGVVTGISVAKDKSCTGTYFSSWSAWGACSITCGSGGTHKRTRRCMNEKGGKTCSGPREETDVCPPKSCPKLGQYGQWSKCTASCNTGKRSRIRKCINGEIGDDGCSKEKAIEIEPCNKHPCPEWSAWRSWETCTQTCGSGTQSRKRTCTGKTKSSNCEGSSIGNRKCNEDRCPGWSSWDKWSDCSVTCAGGSRTSKRQCIGKGCPGPSTRSERCNEKACPQFGNWGKWSKCSKTCGGGERERTRPCENGNIGDIGCEHTKEKAMEQCNEMECPKWTNWATWSKCTTTCGTGKRERNRKCMNGEVTVEGCTGHSEENESCNTVKCPEWTEWSFWSDCSVTCAGGQQSSTRSCDGEGCPGQSSRNQKCNDKPCPTFNQWQAWSSCDTTCDSGFSTRKRTCRNGKLGEKGCEDGKQTEKKKCHEKKCPVFGKWSPWGDCSASCGGGEQYRERTCLHSTMPSECEGDSKEKQRCNVADCPGIWKSWSTWSDCDVRCGTGISKRNRECEGGKVGEPNCDDGPENESRKCVFDPCPSQWNDWQQWSTCSRSCDRGMRTRKRTCSEGKVGEGGCVPAEANSEENKCNEIICSSCGDFGGEIYCEQYFPTPEICSQYEELATLYCQSHCGYCPSLHEDWAAWSACSSSCGSGFRRRRRVCKNERFGCDGSTTERERCRGQCRGFTRWSKWGSCSVTCGSGIRTRTRDCSFEKCVADNSGSTALSEEEKCNMGSCGGTWGDWSGWGECSVTCGATGNEQRSRECIGEKRANNQCPGEKQETRTCRSAIACQEMWLKWSDWGSCSVTCGIGEREKTRQCVADMECQGKSTMSEKCDAGQCISKWGEWGKWSACDGQCTQTRKRKCIDGTISNQECVGESTETARCDAPRCAEKNNCDDLPDYHWECNGVQASLCRSQPEVRDTCQKSCCIAEASVVPIADCEDKEDYCIYTDLCNDDDYRDLFREKCAKSCNYC